MKTKIITIVITALIGLPVAVSGSSIVSSLIDGKTPSEAVIILAGQIDSLLSRVAILEDAQVQTEQDIDGIKSNQTQAQLEIEKLRLENENLKLQAENIEAQAKITTDKQECDTLSRNMPDKRGYDNWGPVKTIVEIYNRAETLLAQSGEWDNQENMELVRKVYAEAKPLYEAYTAQCE